MELQLYLSILRRRWPLVVAVPLLVALISGAVALMRPPSYRAAARLLVTRGATAPGAMAGLTDQHEDKTAQDMPAIISGEPFRRDLAAELARRGRTVDAAALAGALQAGSREHEVTIAAQAARPEDAVAMLQAAIDLVGRGGLRYWGDPYATPERPGLNIAVLDPPERATRSNGLRSILIDMGLRALLGLIAAIGVVFTLHALDSRQPTIEQPAINDRAII